MPVTFHSPIFTFKYCACGCLLELYSSKSTPILLRKQLAEPGSRNENLVFRLQFKVEVILRTLFYSDG